MTQPHQNLLELYGNDELLKEANLPLAARVAAAVLTLGLLSSDKKHQEDVEEEQERLVDLAREVEASKMKQTNDALSKTGAALGRMIAQAELQKEALGVPIFAPFAKAMKGLTKATFGTSTGRKALTGAGVLGAGYLGYKGMQTARDYMKSPGHTNASWGAANAPLMHNVNEYGYPVY